MVTVGSELVPLAACGWFQREGCGCIVAAMVAVPGDGNVYATAEQAAKHMRPKKSSRDKDAREGRTWELITMAYYREHIGAKWECAEHAPAAQVGGQQ